MNLPFKLAYNSLAQLSARVISSATVVAITFLITRNLSKDIWGDFVTVTSYVAIFTLIADFGLNGILVRYFSQAEEKIENYFQNLLGLRLVLSLVSIFVALAVLAFLPYNSSVKFSIIVALALIITQALFNTSAVIFQYKLAFEKFAFADIIGSLVTFLLAYLAVKANSPLFVIVLVFIAGSVTKAILGLWLARVLVKFKTPLFNLNIWKMFLISALPLGLMLLFSQINANIDKQIIALSHSGAITAIGASVAVAIYGLSYRIFDFIIALPTFIMNAVYPVLLNKHKEDKLKLIDEAREATLLLGIVGGVIAIALWFLSPQIVEFFGNYSQSVISLRILLLGVPVFYMTSLLVWLIITIGREKFLAFVFGLAVLFNLVLNLILIPQFGYNAAAVVTVLTEILIFVLLLSIIFNYKLALINEKNTGN